MANQTVAITPADVADPTLLFRALARITEELDALKGYRGTAVEDQQQELEDLIAATEKIRQQLQSFLSELNLKIQDTPKSLQDLQDSISSLETAVNLINSTKPTLGLGCVLTGANSSNPAVSKSYNVTSVVRLSTGNYRITLTNANVASKGVLANAVLSVNVQVAGNVFAKVTSTTPSSTQLDLSVFSLSGTFTAVAYDLTPSDKIDVIALLSP